MPTFHHWRAGKQRNGLTFQTAADARAFDKGIIKAYDDLIDGKSAVCNLSKLNYNFFGQIDFYTLVFLIFGVVIHVKSSFF